MPFRVLLVDDDFDQLSFLELCFLGLQVEIRYAATLQQARSLVTSGNFDSLVIDAP